MTKSSRDPAFESPTADELEQWAKADVPENDHYYRVPARDQAERDAYDHIERVEAEAEEAAERNYHFDGWPGRVAPHEYACELGCPYESDAERDARIDRGEEFARLRKEELEELDDGQPDPATSYPTFDDDPARWGLKTEQYASQAEADAAELLELWGPDGPPASYAAYVAEIEADREAGA